jgi:hypothetical protein
MSFNNEREEREALIFAAALSIVERTLMFFVLAPNAGRISGHTMQQVRTQTRRNSEVNRTRALSVAGGEPYISWTPSLDDPIPPQRLIIGASRQEACFFFFRPDSAGQCGTMHVVLDGVMTQGAVPAARTHQGVVHVWVERSTTKTTSLMLMQQANAEPPSHNKPKQFRSDFCAQLLARGGMDPAIGPLGADELQMGFDMLLSSRALVHCSKSDLSRARDNKF